MIRCIDGHSKCYFLGEICSYRLNLYNQLIPCRNGGHLQSCKNFECNLMFKCIETYCIPWPYVCDGKWDCPEGDDELKNPVCTEDQLCVYMYKCRNAKQTCIHIGNVCDQKTDCPLGDDELHCYFKQFKCHPGCHCLLFAIHCKYMLYNNINFETQPSYLSVIISHPDIYSLKMVQIKFKDAIIVKLPQNCIKIISNISVFMKILILDLEFNCLQKVKRNCASSFYLLEAFYLNDNNISFIEAGSFNNVSKLRYLNLSNNPILNLPSNFLNSVNN